MAVDYLSRNTVIPLQGFKPVDPSKPMNFDSKDLTGKKIGKLRVIRYAGRRYTKDGCASLVWICQCECGQFTAIASVNLFRPNARCGRCGLGRNYRPSGNISAEPMYKTWRGVILRVREQIRYVKRGMCDGFRDYRHFCAVVGAKPSPAHSLDREDNTGGYWCGCCDECKSLGRTKNVRWATAKEQGNNKGNNIHLTYKGETHSAEEWAAITGKSKGLIVNRHSRGWTPEQIFETELLKNTYYKNPIYSDKKLQQQCGADYAAGQTTKQLGKKYGCNPHYVSQLLAVLDIPSRDTRQRRKRRNSQRSLFDKS